MITLDSLTHYNGYSIARFDHVMSLNQLLLQGFLDQQHATTTRKDHYFGGRYENIYIDESQIPALHVLRTHILDCAADILNLPVAQLQYGAWFNAMSPGDETQPHIHDDYDERLSAVYYIQAAPNSGNLCLALADAPVEITPVAGYCIFFDPACEHAVSKNQSDQLRLSIGINIGHADADQE